MRDRARTAVRAATTSALVAVLTLGAAACASGGGGGSSSSGDPDQITREQIDENRNYTNAFEIIQRLRPRWLRTARSPVAGPGSPFAGLAAEPVVFVDGLRFGELASLRSIALTGIESIEYLDARDATTLYGTGYQGGAIQITMRRGL